MSFNKIFRVLISDLKPEHREWIQEFLDKEYISHKSPEMLFEGAYENAKYAVGNVILNGKRFRELQLQSDYHALSIVISEKTDQVVGGSVEQNYYLYY